MTLATGRISAFTEVKIRSESRLKTERENLESKIENLVLSSAETISKLQSEITTLKRQITILNGTLKKEELTKEAIISAVKAECDVEKQHRKQAEKERDFLLSIFKKYKPVSDHLDPEARDFMTPFSVEMTERELKAQYDSWEQDWQDFLKLRS